MTLRRRLTLVLALAVGLSGIALAAGSYFLVRHNLLSDSVDSSIVQTRQNLAVAPAYLRHGGKLVDAYKSRGDFLTVATRGGETFLSSASVSLRSVPAGLRELVGRGQLGYERTTVAGDRFLVIGGPAATGAKLYFFFPEHGLRHELVGAAQRPARRGRDPRAAGGAGGRRARARARSGRSRGRARPRSSLAEGLLETRLPVEGRDEFGAWAQSFNEMAGALEAKIGALSAAQARERRFTADVAHELRTPLTALVGEASLLGGPPRRDAAGVAPARPSC